MKGDCWSPWSAAFPRPRDEAGEFKEWQECRVSGVGHPRRDLSDGVVGPWDDGGSRKR